MFFDLSKAFDKTSRIRLFYYLLTQYRIGGKYLCILQTMYTSNNMYICLDEGLTQPFVTTTGVFKGCNVSPNLFNLYTGKLSTVFDQQCDPVYVSEQPVHMGGFAQFGLNRFKQGQKCCSQLQLSLDTDKLKSFNCVCSSITARQGFD